jgi:aldehyde dehydrogenase (NAD+)
MNSILSELSEQVLHRANLYIGGEWVAASGADRISVENPATEEVLGSVPDASGLDVDRAVAAACEAFEPWATTSPAERARILTALHDRLAANADILAATITAELGAPVRIARPIQVDLPLRILKSYAELAATVGSDERVGNSSIVFEPAGVVAAITPWNYPLYQIISKVGPALAAGCTVILKPPELTPIVAFMLADAAEAVGVPPGVLNVVTGEGPLTGRALVQHPDVDVVSFTGSTAVGRQVAADAAPTIKRVALELGGKSANVILEDADLATAVRVGVGKAMLNGGQTCLAWSRMLVPEERYAEALELAAAAASRYVPGDPTDDSTRLGPLASSTQRTRVTGYVADAIARGATAVAGGPELPNGRERGHFVHATVLSGVQPSDPAAQEEIFGPVLVVLPYRDEDEAVAIANGTIYGLAAGVWSADPDRATSVARRLRAGSIDINGADFNPLAPFGGFKQSGVGRELGVHALREFLELKSIQQ